MAYCLCNMWLLCFNDFFLSFWTDQGNNVGSQYRSGIYYYNPEQEKLARESLEYIGRSWAKPNETFALDSQKFIYT